MAALLAGCGAEAPVAPATESPSPAPGAHLVEASVLCARPARPGDRKAVTGQARTRAAALAERIVRELGALPPAPTP